MLDLTNKIKHLVLVIGDVAILYFSLWLTLLIRYNQAVSAERWQQHFLPFSILFVVWIIIFYISGIYSLQMAKNNVSFFNTLFKTIMWCILVALAFFYVIKPGIAPKTNLLLQIIIFLILFVG